MNSNFWEDSKLRLVDFVFFFFDRQVTLFEEFMLLKEFEKRENSFANKVNTKLSEKEEMQEKVLRKNSQRCAVCFFSSNVDCRVANSTKYFYIPPHFLSIAPALIIGLSILLGLAKLKNLCSCRRS